MVDSHRGSGLPLYRLYILRAAFALLAFAQGSKTWPALLHHTRPWDFWHGVGTCFFGALTALSLLGIRYPVKMIPLMIFEIAWKVLWGVFVWLPLYLAGHIDADTANSAFGILPIIVVGPLVLPWGYVWKNFVTAPGDRWR